MFAGAKAVSQQACTALLDTVTPVSFIQEKAGERMLACGAASTRKHREDFMGCLQLPLNAYV